MRWTPPNDSLASPPSFSGTSLSRRRTDFPWSSSSCAATSPARPAPAITTSASRRVSVISPARISASLGFPSAESRDRTGGILSGIAGRPPRIERVSPKTRPAEKGLPQALARFGFLARGTVYLVVGVLAARVAILQRGRTLGPAEALAKILSSWHGRITLWIVAAGLLAFVLFRAVQCLRTRGRLARIGYAVGALGGLVLAVTAVRTLLRFHAGGDAQALREAAARLVSHAWGRGALELGGAIALCVGVVEALRAAVGKLPADFTSVIMARGQKKWTARLARVGVLAHGAIVAVTG